MGPLIAVCETAPLVKVIPVPRCGMGPLTGVGVGVGVGLGVGVGPGVGVGLGDGVGLGVGEGVGDGLGDGLGLGEGLGVGAGVELTPPPPPQAVIGSTKAKAKASRLIFMSSPQICGSDSM